MILTKESVFRESQECDIKGGGKLIKINVGSLAPYWMANCPFTTKFIMMKEYTLDLEEEKIT